MLLRLCSATVSIGTVVACERLDLAFEPGQCWALLGGNGAGKTTLLHTLAGLRPPASGSIQLHGESIAAMPRRRIARTLGLLPQDSQDAFPATVLETALIGRHPHLSPWQWEGAADRDLACAALRAVGLEQLAGRQVDSLSGGERRRLAVATLLTQAPKIWLLDEPTNHLDLHHQVQILELVTERVRRTDGVAILALHDLNLAARFCDHALLLFGSGEVRHGPVSDVFTTDLLSRLYNHRLAPISAPWGNGFVAD